MITTRGRTQRLSPLVTLSMLSTFAVLLCNRGVRGIATCPYEPFPGHDYMQTRGGAWHIQGDFYVNVSNAERRATVPILIEHPGTYLRLALGSFSSGYTMSASISTNTNTLLTTDSWGHLSGTITEVGSYDLTITGTPSSSSSSSANNACTHGHIEFFARSGAVMKEESEYYSKERCKTQSSVLPEIDFTDISNFHYVSDMHIDDGDDYYVIPNVIGHISSPWEFSVPSDAAASYRFAANLRTEFGSGGFLRLLLQPNYNSSSSSFPTDVAECVRRGGCVLSEHDHLNSASIAAFLPPGSYALWLYWGEASHYNSTVSPRCVPFGLTLDITAGGDGAEGFTACTALPLPATLNSGARGSGTETLDSNGCIHMHRSVLVESVRGHSTTVALSRKSHLRVHVISPDDVDIDIYVRDADTGHIITSSTRTSSGSGMPEAVSAVLPEGRYAIEFSRLTGGLPAGSLCNSFELDLAIAPTTTTTATATHKDFCADVGKTVLPNLEGMSKLSEFSGEFHFGEASTGFPYLYTSTTGNYKQEVITEQEFETVAATMFRARVGSNFLLNDVTMSITNMDTEEVLYPRHAAPNAQVFDIFLNPGHYAFRVHSGLVQDTFDYTIGSDYPRCALYTLALDVVPVHTLSTEELLCRGYRVLPTTFNDAEWLETSDTRLHTTETLRGPRLTPTTPTNSSAALMTGTSTATINVERTAYLRVFVGSANTRDIDIDLLLLTKDAVLADAHSFGATTTTNGESISYILEPDVDYTLRLDFLRYSSSSSSDECFTYPMEVMIAPYNESSSVPMCKDSKIPTSAKVFPSSGIIDNTFEHVDTYWMPRDDSRSSSSNMVMARLSFTVPQLTRFRALVTGDFLYSQLALRLEETERGYTSELLYGGYELSAQSLAPGTYTLVIYAPYDSKTLPEGPIRTACIETTLHIGAEPVYLSGSSSSSSSICEYSTVPDTLNTPGFVHMLTGQHVVINGRYRASVGDGRKSDGSYHDHINFNLNKTMLYRVLVPDARNTGGLDVDVTIHRGTTEIIKELVDKSENSESADMLYGILQPDNYVLTFTYYGAAAAIVAGGGGSSSLSYTCMSFPVYAEFGPNESYESTDSCEEKVTVPGEILFNEEVTETLFWSPSARKQYSASIPFAVYADAARVRMELLTKAFVPGGLTFHITGHTQSGLLNVSARVDAAVGAEGRAWLDEYLLSGTYTLWITDLASRAVHEAVEYVGCAEYNLTYYIDTTVDPNSEGICTQAESLPSDLYTERGGSIEYGGPQADDGTALVAGEHFLLPNSRAFKDRTRWTQITISEPSFVRVYAQTQEPDDVDVFLYRDRNNISSYIGASISAGDYENALWYVNPERDTGINDGGNGLSTTYDIQTRVDTVDEVQACNYFQWAVAVRPRSKAAGDIACPASLPPEADRVPRETIRVQGAQTLVPSSPSYVLTSAFIDAHTLESKLFRYRMTLDVRGSAGAVVTAAASFNFLLSDLRLVLRDSVTEQVLSASMGPKSLPNRRNTLNFRSTLAVVLSKGKYYLDLEEDIRGKATFLNTTYCIPFDFTLLARSDGGSVVSDSGSDSESGSAVIIGGGPEITYVDPQNMWDIEPCDNLYIDIHFSECPANVYAERDNLTAFLNAHGQKMVRMVEIEDYEEAPTVFPIDYAILSENAADDWVLGLRFAAEKLIIASTYILRLNSSAFVTAGGEPFADPAAAAGVKYRYMMSICDCGGHGLCDVTGVSSECLRCECDVPWTGPNCAACMEGYHAFGDTCVEDPVCGPDSCNGHGTCDASSGSIVCTCATGYASPTDAENNPCSICALGYTGYPDCVYDAAAAGADCADPLLPASLATVPYLGWKGYADVAGTFHVDTHRFSHDIEFALDRDSIFRVYAAPNSDFDVDLWLYSVDPTDASLTIIAYEISMDSAETMFLTLAGGPSASAPAKYLLRLRYYIWSNNNNNNEFNENVKKKMIRSTGMSGTTTTSVCESIDFSLSIAPVDATKPALDEMVKRCAAEDDLPEVPFTEVTDSVSYDPGHNFTVRAVRGAWAEPRYFWSHDFTVCAKGYHTAMLQAHVGSRFLPGQVVMALERHPADGSEPNHCDTDSSTGRCALGEAALNGNFLHRALQPGAYRLWLLEPALQDLALANCSLFEFSFRIDYLDVAESVFECDGSDLPATLNAPGFLGTTNTTTGSVHIHDHYAIYGNASSVAFELTEASHFRVASLSSSSSTSTTSSSNNDGTLFSLCINGTCTAFASTIIHALNPGQYLLHVQPPVSWLSEDDGRIVKCINVGLELAIEPVARVVAAPCPASLAEPDPATVLPEFGTYGPPLSYGINDSESGSGFGEYLEFMASAPYKAVSTRVAQYTIVITELSTFDVSVMSSFLYHDLGMTLYFLSGGEQFRVAGSRRGYNSQRIQATLIAGTYLLTLDVPDSPRPESLPSCLPFNFVIRVMPFSDSSALCELEGEPLPASFNGRRFAGTSGFDYLGTEFRVAYGLLGDEETYIPINITAPTSLVKVYVPPNNVVDIDIALMNSKGTIVAAGHDETFTEEAFAVVVPAGEYKLIVTQWNWGDEPFTDCQTFAMEVMVTSVYAPQECPQTITTTSITRRDDDDDDDDDQWPPEYPEEIEEDYEYTSAGADLWYRQTAEDQVGHQYRFRLEHTSDFAAQVRYDFPTGQLSLVLQRLVEDEDDDDDDNNNNRKDATTTMITATTIAESHYSEHGRGRSVLRALGIPAGEYVLVMYEPSPVPSETAGCSHIEFTTIVRRKRAAYLTEDMTLPPSLDTIPYLGFDHSMHVQDTYVLFRGNGSSSSSSDITTEATTFTLWEPSTVHVHAVLQAEYARGKLLNLTIVYVSGAEGSEYVVAEGTTELHTALETPGVYRLEVSKGTDVLEMEGGGVLADMEVSVQPVAKLREVVAAAPQDPNCVDTLVPPVTLSPEGYYFYDGDDAALAISYATLVKSSSSSGHVVQRLKLEVRVPSRVYAQVGYEFGLGHLELAITQADAVGSQQRNVNTLRATLRQPGTYYLDIRSPAGPPALQPPQEPLEYCFPFTFVLSVVPATKGGSGGGCVYKDPVPWDLNRYDGGSARFGGPIDDATGALLLYGDSFAVPAGTASSEMAVAVAEDSALSILLTAGTGLKSVRAQLYECSSDENENGECANRMLVAPLGSAELTGGAQQLTTFALSGGGGGKEGITATATTNNNNKKYYVVLKYGEVDGDCGEFGMQVEVKRVEALRAALVCDEGFVPADPPAQTLVPDEHGFARDIRSSAFYADKPLATSTAPYEIGLALNVTSKVVATLSFSPLTDLYGLNLMALYSGGSSVRARAALRSQQQMTSDLATVTLALADTVGIVPSSETHYGLRITQDNWTSPVATGGQTGKDKQLCLPYIYTAYAIPQNGLPYVSEVTPAGARDLVPGDSITLYVTFSSPVYTAGERALMPATEEVMKKTFYLYDRLSGSTASHIFPESCVCIGTSSSVSNTARWGITFSSSELAPLVDYQLGLADNNTLVDASGEEVRYVFVNVYHTIDTSCNGHGTLTGTTTPTCVCDKGYAGQTCQACDAGYVNVGTGTKGKALRCIPAMTCEEDTCGCDYNDDDNNDNNNSNNNDGGNNYQYTCIPLGECDVNASSGLAHCVCKEGYDGPYCRVCADGWDGWPRCIPCFNGATWDTENERCICAGNFAGPKCQQCRFGYSGKDCATYGGAIFGVFLGLAVIAVVVVVVVVLVRRRSAAAKTPYRTYQRVITSIGSGNGYDDELDEEDDGEDWSSVPSAAREARKPQVFTLRKAECELFADDGLQNPDEDEDVKKEESSSDAGSKGKGKGKDKDNEDELDFFAQK